MLPGYNNPRLNRGNVKLCEEHSQRTFTMLKKAFNNQSAHCKTCLKWIKDNNNDV